MTEDKDPKMNASAAPSPAAAPAHPPLRRNRNFALLWTGAGATMLAARTAGIAYPLLVLWHGGSASRPAWSASRPCCPRWCCSCTRARWWTGSTAGA